MTITRNRNYMHSDVGTTIIENEKGEGVILRNNTHIYKIKKEETIDAVITGYTTEEKANEIRSISFGVFINQNEIMHIGSSGNFSDLNLKKLLFNESRLDNSLLVKLVLKEPFGFSSSIEFGIFFDFRCKYCICQTILMCLVDDTE